jgi:hypothetical protein
MPDVHQALRPRDRDDPLLQRGSGPTATAGSRIQRGISLFHAKRCRNATRQPNGARATAARPATLPTSPTSSMASSARRKRPGRRRSDQPRLRQPGRRVLGLIAHASDHSCTNVQAATLRAGARMAMSAIPRRTSPKRATARASIRKCQLEDGLRKTVEWYLSNQSSSPQRPLTTAVAAHRPHSLI